MRPLVEYGAGEGHADAGRAIGASHVLDVLAPQGLTWSVENDAQTARSDRPLVHRPAATDHEPPCE